MRLKPRLPAKRLEQLTRMEREVRRVAFEPPEGFDPAIDYLAARNRGLQKGLAVSGRHQADAGDLSIHRPESARRPCRSLVTITSSSRARSRSTSCLIGRCCSRSTFATWTRRQSSIVPQDEEANPDLAEETRDASRLAREGLCRRIGACERASGSARPTPRRPASRQNVELLIELHGSRWHCGVEAVLDGKGNGADSFGSLLTPYDLSVEPTLPDPALEKLEEDVESASPGLRPPANDPQRRSTQRGRRVHRSS